MLSSVFCVALINPGSVNTLRILGGGDSCDQERLQDAQRQVKKYLRRTAV